MRGMTAIGALVCALLLGAAGCSEPGPAEKAGEAIDNAVEETEEKLKGDD
jgi:hypothetical protein